MQIGGLGTVDPVCHSVLPVNDEARIDLMNRTHDGRKYCFFRLKRSQCHEQVVAGVLLQRRIDCRRLLPIEWAVFYVIHNADHFEGIVFVVFTHDALSEWIFPEKSLFGHGSIDNGHQGRACVISLGKKSSVKQSCTQCFKVADTYTSSARFVAFPNVGFAGNAKMFERKFESFAVIHGEFVRGAN